jgi:hypothetical protein
VNRDVLDDAVRTALQTIQNEGPVAIEVGESDVPSTHPALPYLILFQSPSPRPEGSMADREDMPYYDYRIKSVGRNHKETERLASQAKEVMRFGSITATGFEIVSCHTISDGVVSRSMGPNLFEKDDVYRICVTPA